MEDHSGRRQRRADIARIAVRRGPHVDARDDAHRKEHRDERAAAVGEERQRQADDRHEADAHADVDEHLRRQHTGDTDADEPVHIVAGLDADVDDADDDGRQQNEDRHAAEHAQLLTDGGEDQVGVLRGDRAALHHRPVVESLAGDAAVLQRAQTAVHLIALVLRQRVDARVKQDPDAAAPVIAEELPQKRRGHQQNCSRTEEPQQAHAADECHDDENKQILQRNAEILRRHNDQAEHKDRDHRQPQHRRDMRDLVLPDAHRLGEDHDERDLADLRRLDGKRQEAEVQPGAVAASGVAEGEEQQDEDRREDQQQLTPLRNDIHVDQGEHHI